MFRTYPKQLGGVFRTRTGEEPLLEAIHLLEHSELVLIRSVSDTHKWTATRLGLATVSSGKAAVRQRIKDRTGL